MLRSKQLKWKNNTATTIIGRYIESGGIYYLIRSYSTNSRIVIGSNKKACQDHYDSVWLAGGEETPFVIKTNVNDTQSVKTIELIDGAVLADYNISGRLIQIEIISTHSLPTIQKKLSD